MNWINFHPEAGRVYCAINGNFTVFFNFVFAGMYFFQLNYAWQESGMGVQSGYTVIFQFILF